MVSMKKPVQTTLHHPILSCFLVEIPAQREVKARLNRKTLCSLPSWTLTNSSTWPCNWTGIRCNEVGTIVEVLVKPGSAWIERQSLWRSNIILSTKPETTSEVNVTNACLNFSVSKELGFFNNPTFFELSVNRLPKSLPLAMAVLRIIMSWEFQIIDYQEKSIEISHPIGQNSFLCNYNLMICQELPFFRSYTFSERKFVKFARTLIIEQLHSLIPSTIRHLSKPIKFFLTTNSVEPLFPK